MERAIDDFSEVNYDNKYKKNLSIQNKAEQDGISAAYTFKGRNGLLFYIFNIRRAFYGVPFILLCDHIIKAVR